jgi:hypothetical protein
MFYLYKYDYGLDQPNKEGVMNLGTYKELYALQYGESYPGYAERIAVAIEREVRAAKPVMEKVTALAVLAALAPNEVDSKTSIDPRPTKQIKDFLANQAFEAKSYFREMVLQVNPRLTDKANYYLAEFN